MVSLICLGNKDKRSNVHVVHLDQNLEEVKRWKIGDSAHDMTVFNDKLYVSFLSHPDIIVYDPHTGATLSTIIRNGSSAGLTSYSPNSLIILDYRHNSVLKYELRNDMWTIVWTTTVIKPLAVQVDDHGLIWVHSNTNDCTTVLSRKGMCCCQFYAMLCTPN